VAEKQKEFAEEVYSCYEAGPLSATSCTANSKPWASIMS